MSSAIGVVNAFSEEYTHMRRSLAPRLLMAAAENIKHSERFGFFEIGKAYAKNQISSDPLLKDIAKKPFRESKKIA
jgi:phenylalanyl-tRNA synthetase beta subunit